MKRFKATAAGITATFNEVEASVLRSLERMEADLAALQAEVPGGRWIAVIDDEYQRFCDRVDAGDDTLVDPYGAESVDEFFAVGSEHFFVAPQDLAAEHPRLYELLAGYYRQDPGAILAV